jgi:glyoxylase-like metal-dependent hydrolase (beta-lactamase superfamily II)
MAKAARRLADNVPGDFYVDATCIDCETCQSVAPATFAQGAGEWSYVRRQPADAAEEARARMALVACPVAAIGTTSRHDFDAARRAFPEPVEGDVHYCGWAAAGSFGARSYLVVRPGGNVLVDSPRFAAALVERIAALGGVRWMFLTHRDDVADHRKFRRRFGCERILHRDDVTVATRDVERVLDGRDPIRIDSDFTAIPVPGHTPGSAALLYRGRFLFSGDHAWWDPRRSQVTASRSVCWWRWDEQARSMAALAGHAFEWLLPGHGMPVRLPAGEMREQVAACARRMRGGTPT